MQVIDKAAKTWFINLGAFRLPHPFRDGVVFEPATKYMVSEDEWMAKQPTLVQVEIDEDTEGRQLYPKQPGSPQFDKEADDAAAAAAVAELIASKKAKK